jgi:hypothetical protein
VTTTHRFATGHDVERTRLRSTLATLEREILRVSPEDARAWPSALLATFRDLAALLALGPEPEVRPCPACGAIGMRAATRCGACWSALTPPVG